MRSDASVLIPLKDIGAVPEFVVLRLLDMEARGIHFHFRDDGLLYLGPRASVTSDDLAFVEEHRALVIDVVQYVDRLAEAPL